VCGKGEGFRGRASVSTYLAERGLGGTLSPEKHAGEKGALSVTFNRTKPLPGGTFHCPTFCQGEGGRGTRELLLLKSGKRWLWIIKGGISALQGAALFSSLKGGGALVREILSGSERGGIPKLAPALRGWMGVSCYRRTRFASGRERGMFHQRKTRRRGGKRWLA